MLELQKKMQESNFEEQVMLSKNHRNKFKTKLGKRLHKKLFYNSIYFKVAATVVILLGLTYFIKGGFKNTNQVVENTTQSIKDLSPELGKIESYYTTAINYELANLPISDENNTLIKNYLSKIEILSTQYKILNDKLLKGNLSESVINNLITNLQMRLQLLLELKTQLNKTKSIENENNTL
jgi:hypothetical protein